ncbi:MAG: response regulator [Deltaproteobacteria bacterium]|nr:response regulator [Deltaproteobacteria bacterium]
MEKILVVDDHYAVRQSFKLALSGEEIELVAVSSGFEAVELIKQTDFSLIFLDLNMPQINGIDTFLKLKEIQPEVFVYFITAFHQDYFHQLIKLNKDGYQFEILIKPINDDEIIGLIKSFINNSSKVA